MAIAGALASATICAPSTSASADSHFVRLAGPRAAARLGSPDAEVRLEILGALARRARPEAIEALLSRPRTPAEQRDAIRALAALDDPRALAALCERLGPESTRDAAVRALGRVGPRAFSSVMHALRDPTQRVGASRALGEMGDIRAVPELVRAIASRCCATRTR